MILLQIVMVSPGTHLVKNHESPSITNESQLKKTRSPKLKMLGPLCNQTVNRETDVKTLYYSLLKKEFARTGYSTKKSSNRSIILCLLQDICHELFCVFGDFYAPGMQDI